jgi:MFS family permease
LALAAFNIAVGSGAEAGTTSQFVEQAAPAYQGPLLIVAISTFLGFIFRELRAEQPLLDLRLFKQKTFSGASLVNLGVGFALIVALGVVPLFINAVVASSTPNASAAQILSDGAWYTGWVLSALTVTMALTSVFIGRIVNRFGYRAPTVIGLLTAALGFFITSRWDVNTTYWQMVPGLLIAGLGFGLVLAPIATAVVNSAPDAERGTASALVIILRLVGMSLGGSIALSWGTQRVQTLSAEFAAGQSQFAMDTLAIFRHATAQAVADSFLLFAVVACLVAVLPALWMRPAPVEPHPAA